jgi:hypothetical protein
VVSFHSALSALDVSCVGATSWWFPTNQAPLTAHMPIYALLRPQDLVAFVDMLLRTGSTGALVSVGRAPEMALPSWAAADVDIEVSPPVFLTHHIDTYFNFTYVVLRPRNRTGT